MNSLPSLPYELLYEIFKQTLPEVEDNRHLESDPLLYAGYSPRPAHPAALQAECLRILTICKALNRIIEEFLYTNVYLRSNPICLDRFVSSAACPPSYTSASGHARGEYTRRIRMERLERVNSITTLNLIRLKEVCPNLTAVSMLGRLGLSGSPGPDIWLKGVTSLEWGDIELNSIVHRYLSGGVDTLQSLSLRGACGGTFNGTLEFNRLTKLSMVFYSAPLPKFSELRTPILEWLRLDIQYRAKDGALSEFLTNNGRNLTFLCIDNVRNFYSTGKLVETFAACPRLETYMENLVINTSDLDPTRISSKHNRLRRLVVVINPSSPGRWLVPYSHIFTRDSFPALQSLILLISNRLGYILGKNIFAVQQDIQKMFPHLNVETKMY